MFASVKQNLLLLIFIGLTLNIMLLSGYSYFILSTKPLPTTGFEIIECGDGTGKIHKCIRIDAKAGEINDAAKGASYRVIYGQ